MKFGNRRSMVAVVAALGVTGMALTSCSAGGGDAGDGDSGTSGTLTLGSRVDLDSFDSAQAHVGHYMPFFQAAYDTLIRQEPDGTLTPMLATDWEYNEDRTALTLDLRTDVTFSDGAVFDAEAVKANIEHFQTANGRQASTLEDVESVEVVDDDTVTLNLSAPNPSLEYYLSQAAGFMGSPEALGTDEMATVPVGSGPYVIDEAASAIGVEYTFTRRDDYWNPDLQKFDTVVFKILDDDTARGNALATGQVDGADVLRSTLPQIEGAGLAYETRYIDWNGLMLLDREGAITPALGDVRVRQAINMALDRDALAEAGYGDTAQPTAQVFGEAATAFSPDFDSFYEHDLEAAKALMAEAGYADGFTLAVPTLGQDMDVTWALIGDQLAEIGVTLSLDPVEFPDFLPGVAEGRWSVAEWSLFQGETWVAAKQLLVPQALYNPFRTTTPEMEALLDAVRQAPAEEVEPAVALNEYVLENAWFAPTYRVPAFYGFDPTAITVETQSGSVVPALYNYAPTS
jgi:peptide/nickel transport system substrate-binding protein